MTFDQIREYFWYQVQVFQVNKVFYSIIEFISDNPLVMFAVLVTVVLPSVAAIIPFIFSLIDSSSDFTTEGFKMYKIFRSDDFKKRANEMRKNFHRAKNFDDIPLKIPMSHQKAYDIVDNFKLKSSSSSHQVKRANIDVEVDDD